MQPWAYSCPCVDLGSKAAYHCQSASGRQRQGRQPILPLKKRSARGGFGSRDKWRPGHPCEPHMHGGSCPPALTGSKQSAVPVLPDTVRGCCTVGKKHGVCPWASPGGIRNTATLHARLGPRTLQVRSGSQVVSPSGFPNPSPVPPAEGPGGPSLAPKLSLRPESGRFLGKMANWQRQTL